MNKSIKRRQAIRTALAASGLLLANQICNAATKAKPEADVVLEGEWLSDEGKLCAIFKQGRVLLVVNFLGSIGTAHLIDSSNLIVVGGVGWDAGLKARITNLGKKIEWSNSTNWFRP